MTSESEVLPSAINTAGHPASRHISPNLGQMARRARWLGGVAATVLSLWGGAACAATQYSFYASPTGSGSTCSEAAPCSLASVKTKVRTVNTNLSGDVIVYLRGGTYKLTQALAFTQTDSGSNGYRVVYTAYTGETPIISGGQAVSGWQLYDSTKNIYRAFVGTSIDTRQLFVNGVRGQRARGPYNPAGFSFNAAYGFDISDASLQNVSHPTDLEVVGLVEWKGLRCGVASITATRITMDQPCWGNALYHPVKLDRVSWLENAYEFIDEDGEWYLDRSTGYIYYKPRAGDDMANADAVIPVVESLVTGTGTLAAPIHDLTFSHITFAYNGWLRPNTTQGYPSIQAGFLYVNQTDETVDGFKTPAAVTFTAAHGIRLERNVFQLLGSAGLNLESGSQDNVIIGNRFDDIASSAIQIGHFNESHPSDTRKILKNNSVTDNFINNASSEYFDGVGIFAAYAQNTLIEHNELTNLPYSGISVGWGWGKPDVGGSLGYTTATPAQQNKIQFNSVTDYMRILRDGGGIYTLGSQPSSTINNNYVAQMTNDYAGLYLDEATQFFDVSNNVVAAVPKWLYIWTSSIRNNTVRFNYSDTTNKVNAGSQNTVSDNSEGLSSWPSAASAIIANAGLEAAYADIRGSSSPPSSSGNIALNRPTTASSTLSSDYAPNLATDGNVSSGWSPSGSDLRPWVQVDLGSANVLTGVQYVSRQDLDQPTTRRDFEVRASNDVNFASYAVLDSQGSSPFPYQGTWSATVSDATAYRYVRLAKTVDDYLFVDEFRVLGGGTGGGGGGGGGGGTPTNVALGKSASASSEYDSEYGASKILDGSNAGGWSPTGSDTTPSITIDLGQQYALSSINVITRQDYDQPETRRNFEVWASNNSDMSQGHVVLGSVGAQGIAYQGTFSMPITGGPRYRYVAIVKTQPEYFFVAEVQVLGTP